jgi:hypothetical protein
MSVCRNSTIIPLLAGQANVSHYCTGGITWGRNSPDHLTSGWPFPLFARLSATMDLGTLSGDLPAADKPVGEARNLR